MKQKKLNAIPELKSGNGKMVGGFSSLTSDQMSKISGGANDGCSTSNNNCTNSINCSGRNNACSNTAWCIGRNFSCTNGVAAQLSE